MEAPDPICEAYQIRDYRQSESVPLEEGRVFHIRVELEFIRLLDDASDVEEFQDMVTKTHEDTRVFSILADQLLRHPMTGKNTVWEVLEKMGIPRRQEYDFMGQRILSRASSMARDESNRDLKVLPMGVFISCVDPRDGDRPDTESMDDDDMPRMTVSTSKSSVEGLKKVTID